MKKRVEPTASVTEVEKELDKLKVRKDKDIEKENPAAVQPKILVKIHMDRLPEKPKGLKNNNSDERERVFLLICSHTLIFSSYAVIP